MEERMWACWRRTPALSPAAMSGSYVSPHQSCPGRRTLPELNQRSMPQRPLSDLLGSCSVYLLFAGNLRSEHRVVPGPISLLCKTSLAGAVLLSKFIAAGCTMNQEQKGMGSISVAVATAKLLLTKIKDSLSYCQLVLFYCVDGLSGVK